MPVQTQAAADAELQQWYAARTAASKGKSFTVTTSAGTRTVTFQDVDEINRMITILERRVSQTEAKPHGFAVANFNHSDR